MSDKPKKKLKPKVVIQLVLLAFLLLSIGIGAIIITSKNNTNKSFGGFEQYFDFSDERKFNERMDKKRQEAIMIDNDYNKEEILRKQEILEAENKKATYIIITSASIVIIGILVNHYMSTKDENESSLENVVNLDKTIETADVELVNEKSSNQADIGNKPDKRSALDEHSNIEQTVKVPVEKMEVEESTETLIEEKVSKETTPIAKLDEENTIEEQLENGIEEPKEELILDTDEENVNGNKEE